MNNVVKGSWHESSYNSEYVSPFMTTYCRTINNQSVQNTIKYNHIDEYVNINGILWTESLNRVNHINQINRNYAVPLQIFQTHRSKRYIYRNKKLLVAIQSWAQHHRFRHFFFSDRDQDIFMKIQYPLIYQIYKNLPLPVMKADLWRYCIIYYYGGIYADVDTVCLSSPEKLISNTLLGGVPENSTHLCQWIFSAPPRSPIIKSVINLSIKRIKRHLDHRGYIPRKYFVENEHIIHHLTGPAVFTDGIETWLLRNGYPILKDNRSKYSDYPKHILDFHPEEYFHKKDVRHLYSGSWRDGWKIQKNWISR